MKTQSAARRLESGARPDSLSQRYRAVRATTDRLCAPLTPEDQMVQSCVEASPAKWHRAHTTWFFETFVLEPHARGYRPFNTAFRFLFNSYYVNVGERPVRTTRGMISRPSADEVSAYREHVDDAMAEFLQSRVAGETPALHALIELGLNHEQQHQELIVTDVKHAFWTNPLRPAYNATAELPDCRTAELRGNSDSRTRTREGHQGNRFVAAPMEWIEFDGGLRDVGHTGDGFCFDNEQPRHRVLLEPFRLASRLVTCGEYLEFIAEGGYRTPTLWLSDGWDTVAQNGWNAPLYWEEAVGRRPLAVGEEVVGRRPLVVGREEQRFAERHTKSRQDGPWRLFTCAGMRDLDPHEPVTHVSFYEADAYARWAGARLATEFEWEVACEREASRRPPGETPGATQSAFLEDGDLHPRAANGDGLQQMLGDCWEWTASPYVAYPGFRPAEGALGEYNGKFMCNQMVLRGGSCATPRSHIRGTYRNFFPPQTRWQFSGIRLAK